MTERIVKQIDGIETVGGLRQALEEYIDDMPIGDVFGQSLCLTLVEEKETGERHLEID